MATKKMWHLHTGWDYHRQAGYVVVATTAEKAAEILNKNLNSDNYHTYPASYVGKDFTEIIEGIYEDHGCDD